MKAPKRKRRSLLIFSVFTLTTAGIAIFATRETGAAVRQLQVGAGSVARGERVLTDKGCLGCHALNGKGGTRAPDLAIPTKSAATPALFAASVWNHTPSMLAELESAGKPAPTLAVADAADLFAYLYASLYFAPRGNAAKGADLFTSKQCAVCHSEVLNPQARPSLLQTWMDLQNPSAWAERMWNHATEMDAAMANRGIKWPRLSDQELVDILKFLSTRAGGSAADYELTVGEPEMGETVFESSCSGCHTLGKREAGKVDLLAKSGPSTVTGYIAAMWNHGPEMRRRGGTTAQVPAGRMPDLVAFLFSQRYFFDPGDVERGRKVYEEKDCALCHETRRAEMGAPNLASAGYAYSPVTLTSAAWRHGPAMIQTMKQQRIAWPEFKGRDMADVIAYLNSRIPVRIAFR